MSVFGGLNKYQAAADVVVRDPGAAAAQARACAPGGGDVVFTIWPRSGTPISRTKKKFYYLGRGYEPSITYHTAGVYCTLLLFCFLQHRFGNTATKEVVGSDRFVSNKS